MISYILCVCVCIYVYVCVFLNISYKEYFFTPKIAPAACLEVFFSLITFNFCDFPLEWTISYRPSLSPCFPRSRRQRWCSPEPLNLPVHCGKIPAGAETLPFAHQVWNGPEGSRPTACVLLVWIASLFPSLISLRALGLSFSRMPSPGEK